MKFGQNYVFENITKFELVFAKLCPISCKICTLSEVSFPATNFPLNLVLKNILNNYDTFFSKNVLSR